jgi:hypothetical protein
MKWLWEASDFVRKVRLRMRFGEMSRLPLRLVRLELRHETAVCEWVARANDPWDSDLPIAVAEQNQALQALQDAITVREFLFATLPEVSSANFRVYRTAEGEPVELIIAGTVTREDEPQPMVRSLVMRAKLCGLRFSLSDGVFEALSTQVNSSELSK